MNTTCDSRRKLFTVHPLSCNALSAQRTHMATSDAEGTVLRCVQCFCTYAPRQRSRSESDHLRSGALSTVLTVDTCDGATLCWLGSVCVPLGTAGSGCSFVSFCCPVDSSTVLFSSCCLSCFFPSFFFLWIRSFAAAEVILRMSNSERRVRSQFFSELDSDRGISATVVVIFGVSE